MRALLSNRVMALLALVAVVGASAAEARTAPNRPRRPRATNLFAGANLLFGVNRVLCNLTSTGEICSAGSSPVGGGGFWPNGTPDQYIFNSGLQIGGLVDPAALNDAGEPFEWAGDTVGTYFFDASGGQEAGEALYGVFSSIDHHPWNQVDIRLFNNFPAPASPCHERCNTLLRCRAGQTASLSKR